VVQTGSASQQKALDRRVLGQGHHELKLVSRESGPGSCQHDLRDLLVKVVLTMYDLQPEHVSVEGDRGLQIGDRYADMIKTEQTREYRGELGGPASHAHQGARLVLTKDRT